MSVCISSINWVFLNLEAQILRNLFFCLLFTEKVNFLLVNKEKLLVLRSWKKGKQILCYIRVSKFENTQITQLIDEKDTTLVQERINPERFYSRKFKLKNYNLIRIEKPWVVVWMLSEPSQRSRFWISDPLISLFTGGHPASAGSPSRSWIMKSQKESRNGCVKDVS